MRFPRLNGSDATDPSRCVRCNGSSPAFTMSFYNVDWICLRCDADERELPTYGMAREAEMVALKAGDRNFPGVGLSKDDWTILMRKIEERSKA